MVRFPAGMISKIFECLADDGHANDTQARHALHTLADELGLPELDDFADIMRLSGEEGASVYTNLRARSAAMRTAMLNDEITEANAIGERMTIPGSLLGLIFMALLVTPSLLRMFSNT